MSGTGDRGRGGVWRVRAPHAPACPHAAPRHSNIYKASAPNSTRSHQGVSVVARVRALAGALPAGDQAAGQPRGGRGARAAARRVVGGVQLQPGKKGLQRRRDLLQVCVFVRASVCVGGGCEEGERCGKGGSGQKAAMGAERPAEEGGRAATQCSSLCAPLPGGRRSHTACAPPARPRRAKPLSSTCGIGMADHDDEGRVVTVVRPPDDAV